MHDFIRMAETDMANPNGGELSMWIEEMATSSVAFSRGFRTLYSQHAVCHNESTENFRKIRDAVRQDAAIFAAKVLPLALALVINISAYCENYQFLEYEEWVDSLEGIIKDLEGYEKPCLLLTQMCSSLMTTLKRQQDEAKVSIVDMEELTARLEAKGATLEAEARGHRNSAAAWKFWGDVLAPFTLGISRLVTEPVVDSRQSAANMTLAVAVAQTAQSEIVRKAARMTGAVLIPAVASILQALSVLQAFFAESRANLGKMSARAQTAAGKRENGGSSSMKREYTFMRKNSGNIVASCNIFIHTVLEVIGLLPRRNSYIFTLK